MRIRSLLFSKTGLVFLSTFITLILAAGGYELYARAEYSAWRDDFEKNWWNNGVSVTSKVPGMLWEYRPYTQSNGMAFNRWGFRDRDYPDYSKPKGYYRIAFAGDSVTVALGISDVNLGFVRRFEDGINATHPPRRVQAMNFGIGGFNTPQVAAMVRAKVLPFHPDKVVYVMCMNDFDFTDASAQKLLYFKPPRSFLLDRIEKSYVKFTKQEYHRYNFEKHKDEVFAAVRDMKEQTEAAGAKLELVMIPIFQQGAPDYQSYPLYRMHEEIHKRLDELGVRYTDLLDRFKTSNEPPAHWSIDIWHLSDAGHKAVADALTAAIRIEL